MKTKITDIISWTLLALGTIFLIWKVFGGSPADFSILITFMGSILFKMMTISNNVATLNERVRNLENKFNALASDFKDHIKHK